MPETTVLWNAGALALVLLATAACGSPETKPRAPQSRARAETAPEPLEMLAPLDVLQRLRGGEEDRRACFQASGQASHGFVKLAWRVRADGKVDDVAVVGTSVHDAVIERCLAEQMSKLDFGPRQDALAARWTFVHQLPKMPGADDLVKHRKKARKKKKRRDDQDDVVAGVSIEEASPGRIELQRIEDIVYAGFPLFAYCYRAGLERDPALGGLVQLRFVIDEGGAVMGVMDNGSEFGDRNALDCMAEGIFALSFPAPTGGDVRVQYRIVFESG